MSALASGYAEGVRRQLEGIIVSRPRVLIAGGGYVGFYAARRLRRRLGADQVELTVVNPDNYLTYRPLLPEVASGTVEPRHAVVPLRDTLVGDELVTGRLTGLDLGSREALVTTLSGEERRLSYDHVVVALGAVTRMLPVPGVAEQAIGFTTVSEALGLRDHVLDRMETASGASADRRRRMLTFVFVGGGYTGVEALAELQDMAADVVAGYPDLDPADLRFVLLEATDRLLPTVPAALASKALDQLTGRGIDVRLKTEVERVEDGVVHVSDGTTLETDTLVWVAGVEPDPLVGRLGLPMAEKGRLQTDAAFRVPGHDGVWAAGDCAAVPDLVAGGVCPQTAQYAVRQGRRLGDNLVAAVQGREPTDFRYHAKGEFVTLGNHQAVAEVMGRQVTGLPAWTLRRAYYASQIPTLNRKTRLILDWAVGMPFGHDVVDLSASGDPRDTLRRDAAEEGVTDA